MRDEILAELEEIEDEIKYLVDIIGNDKLYEPNPVLYHTPSRAPGMREQLESQQAFAPKLKSFLQGQFSLRCTREEARKGKFLKKYRGWQKQLSSHEVNDPPCFHAPVEKPPSNSVIIGNGSNLNSGAVPMLGSGRVGRRGTSGDAVRSEAELNQILLSLLEQERDNPATRWMATLAFTPRMQQADPKHIFQDRLDDINGRLPQNYYQQLAKREAPPPVYGQSVISYNDSVVWTEAEQRIFIDKFLAYHKNFRKISSFIPFKRTSDCVAFYYRNKKRLKLKQLRKNMVNDEGLAGRMRSIKKSMGGPGRPPKKARKPGRPPRSSYIQNNDSSTSEEEDGDEEMEAVTAMSLINLASMANSDSVLPDDD